MKKLLCIGISASISLSLLPSNSFSKAESQDLYWFGNSDNYYI